MSLIKKKKLVLTQSMVAAIQLTQIMAEALYGDPSLTLFQAGVIPEKIKDEWVEFPERKLKTDCVFIDSRGFEQVAVAWVHIVWHFQKWQPARFGNFIKLNDCVPRQAKFTHPDQKPLAPRFIAFDSEGADRLDYSRIH
jgi:hypothetical protein